ncbi:MAG: helix-turn-helix domain-containing protein [Prevotellaceae bacterium]|nr:helix-turn-helix domain-containing protein [Prevotellaceae bacterium]
MLQIFLFDMWQFYSREIDNMKFSNITAQTFLRFLHEVQNHCQKNRDVSFYSDLLCITPKYLSEICRKVSGIPALEWITYYARYELVRLLGDLSLTLTDISDRMDFYNQSHFSRYVKRLLGVTPTEYREKLQNNS